MNGKSAQVLGGLIILLFVSGCSNESSAGKGFSGDYSGAIKQADSYVGAWQGNVSAEGFISVTARVLPTMQFSGNVSESGNFTIAEDPSSGDGIGSGSINGETVTGTILATGDTFTVKGRKFFGGADYIGTWYEKTTDSVYRKIVIGSTGSFIEYTDDNNDGVYSEDEISEEGFFTVTGSTFTLEPYAGSFEGIYFVTDDDYLILAFEGISNMFITSMDQNPAAK